MDDPMDDPVDDKALKKLLDSRAEAPGDNTRKRAVNLALAEFDAAQQERNKITQGSSLWHRLTGRYNPNERRDRMNRKMIYGGMATAMVVVMAGTLGVQHYMISVPPAVSVGDFTRAASLKDKAVLHEEVVTDFNIAQSTEGEMAESSAVASAPAMPMAPPMAEARGPVPATQYDRAAPEQMAQLAKREMNYGGAVTSAAPGDAGVMANMVMPYPYPDPYIETESRDQFQKAADNPVKVTAAEPVSTFSIDVDTASYSVVRRMINNGTLPPADAVRVEELVNYFDYDYALPQDKAQPFRASVTIMPSPWNEGRKLMHVGIKGYDIAATEKPRSNLVFLIDVSGSMNAPDKLPLLKSSVKMLLNQMGPDDTVSIVTYAGNAGTVLEPTKASDKAKIVAAIDNLNPGGGTAGAAGIEEAYRLAESVKADGAVNRVVLATDGDFNIGASGPDELKALIEAKRKSGVFLSVLGFGMGNLNDHLMQALAQNGNGTAAYIDNLNEARKVLVEEASSTLFPIAKDVKIQMEFNPATVAEYRLVGYETRHLNREDFNNDAVDAGDIGAGHTVTAIYEITPVGGPRAVDDSRYAPEAATAKADANFADEYAFLKIRYKLPDADTSQLISTPVTKAQETAPSADAQWAAAVAGFGQKLKGGQNVHTLTYDRILSQAQAAKGADETGYRAEFINMVKLAKTLAGE